MSSDFWGRSVRITAGRVVAFLRPWQRRRAEPGTTDGKSFKARRFKGHAPGYSDSRPTYAPRLIERVAASCGLRDGDRLLDLGCGPGMLACAFAPFVGEVVAMDPEPEMVAAAAAAARKEGLRLTLVEGSSYDLGPQLGRFRAVTIGRAFHWMDRVATLQALDRMIEPDGAVVLIGTHAIKSARETWWPAYDAVIGRHAQPRTSGPSRNATSHEAILIDSPFHVIDRLGVIERRETPIERFVDRALSRGETSTQRLGKAAASFAEELRAALAPHARDGLVSEVIESYALIARRTPG